MKITDLRVREVAVPRIYDTYTAEDHARDLARIGLFRFAAGRLRPFEKPGLGVELDEEKMEKWAIN